MKSPNPPQLLTLAKVVVRSTRSLLGSASAGMAPEARKNPRHARRVRVAQLWAYLEGKVSTEPGEPGIWLRCRFKQ